MRLQMVNGRPLIDLDPDGFAAKKLEKHPTKHKTEHAFLVIPDKYHA